MGKTVHVAFHLIDCVLTQYAVVSAASLIIRGALPAPANFVTAAYNLACHSHNNTITGMQRMFIYAGADDIIMQTQGIEPGNASFNRQYTFNPTPQIGIAGTAATTFNPRYSVGGSFTYEIN